MKKAIIIFGPTGNLTYKKLLPALYALVKKNHIRDVDKIFLVARKDWTLDQYIEDAKTQVSQFIDWIDFQKFLEYINIEIGKPDEFIKLKTILDKKGYIDTTFYLALPPELFPIVSRGLNASHLVIKGDVTKKIVFEKPFGEDLKSAEEINRELWKYFDESQTYRIDHYLGKEMIQNILIVRFANKIFEKTWNHNTIRSVVIKAKETEGILGRGNYYDKIGALKDMLQSHLLQMAALITMTKPKNFLSTDIKDAKVKVLREMEIDVDSVVLGQYNGYLKEQKISKNSETETFVFAKAYINNNKWKDIPIYFITGKKLDEKKSEIIINFKDDDNLHTTFSGAKPNNTKLIIKVAPEDGVMFQLNVKQPGLSDDIISGNLDYCHTCNWVGNTAEAYEKLLLDLLNGNKTLFTRWDEIEAMWKIVDSVESNLKPRLIYNDYNHLKALIKKEKGVDLDDL